jgi:1,4-dihydroxy-2-naphthoate polyprenyltransferase
MRKEISRWVRFFEAYMPDGALPVLVGLAAAWQPGLGVDFWLRAALVLLLIFLTVMFVHGSDAIVGHKKGVDDLVYKENGKVKHEKLLVTGEVSMREATIATGIVLALLLAVGAAFAAMTTWKVGLLVLGTLLFATQYSVGLRLSYRGLGEMVVASSGLTATIAHGFVVSDVTPTALLIGIALGLWHAGANVNSNQVDYAYDRAAGRGTLAVRIGLAWHRRFGVLLLVVGWGLFALLIARGQLPIYAAALAVLLPRHVRQLRTMYAGDPLTARTMGFQTFRLLIAGIVGVFVLTGALHFARQQESESLARSTDEKGVH